MRRWLGPGSGKVKRPLSSIEDREFEGERLFGSPLSEWKMKGVCSATLGLDPIQIEFCILQDVVLMTRLDNQKIDEQQIWLYDSLILHPQSLGLHHIRLSPDLVPNCDTIRTEKLSTLGKGLRHLAQYGLVRGTTVFMNYVLVFHAGCNTHITTRHGASKESDSSPTAVNKS